MPGSSSKYIIVEKNELRIDSEDCMKMSALTRTILDGVDYKSIKAKRRENYKYACELFDSDNLISLKENCDDDAVPMVYPLVVEDDSLLNKLQNAKHFQGHWWKYITREQTSDTFEYWLSRYMIPVTIDQRYSKSELDYIRSIVK